MGAVAVVEQDVDQVLAKVLGQVRERLLGGVLLFGGGVALGLGLAVEVYLDYLNGAVAWGVYELFVDWGDLLRHFGLAGGERGGKRDGLDWWWDY